MQMLIGYELFRSHVYFQVTMFQLPVVATKSVESESHLAAKLSFLIKKCFMLFAHMLV